MFSENNSFEYLKNRSLIDYMEFIKMDEIFDHYSNQLPDGCNLRSLRIKFKCIDIRVFDKNMEIIFYRVTSSLFCDHSTDISVGNFVIEYDSEGNRIDEIIDIRF